MRSENILPNHSDGMSFKFELPLTAQTLTEDMPQRPRQDIIEWLNEVPEGRFQYIFEMGDLWGISFERESDALQFKLTWL